MTKIGKEHLIYRQGAAAELVMSTVRSLLLAWVLTLPCAIALSAFLFFVFRHLF